MIRTGCSSLRRASDLRIKTKFDVPLLIRVLSLLTLSRMIQILLSVVCHAKYPNISINR
jgi:hypothetical protein